jgi:hypothetical protein
MELLRKRSAQPRSGARGGDPWLPYLGVRQPNARMGDGKIVEIMDDSEAERLE